jgi:SOS response regulatory protein OraA/RecX
MDEIKLKEARAYAMRRLAMKSTHSQELITKLRERAFSEDIIEAVITECRQNKWLSDEEWVRRFVEKLREKGKSSQEIMPLLQRGNKDSLAHIIPKRYPELLDGNLSREKRQKLIARLCRKGFSLDDITSTLSRIQEE